MERGDETFYESRKRFEPGYWAKRILNENTLNGFGSNIPEYDVEENQRRARMLVSKTLKTLQERRDGIPNLRVPIDQAISQLEELQESEDEMTFQADRINQAYAFATRIIERMNLQCTNGEKAIHRRAEFVNRYIKDKS